MDKSKLSPQAREVVEKIEADLRSEYEAKKQQLAAAAQRRPWTVVAWSAVAGAIVAVFVMKFFGL